MLLGCDYVDVYVGWVNVWLVIDFEFLGVDMYQVFEIVGYWFELL